MLTHSQIEEYKRDGFLFVDQPILPTESVLEARSLLDKLFERWNHLPRRLALGSGTEPAAVAEILHATVLAPQLSKSRLITECRAMAAQILEAETTWCHFDHAIYKSPGTDSVAWHQDLASSKTRLFARSVHFWIPLHDLMPSDGCMMFVPGTHLGKLRLHQINMRPGGATIREAVAPMESACVTMGLPIGGFSIHTPRTLHASSGNSGTNVRKAWILQIGAGHASAARNAARGCVRAWSRFSTHGS